MKHEDGYRQCGRSNSIAGLMLIPSAFGRYPNLLMLLAACNRASIIVNVDYR